MTEFSLPLVSGYFEAWKYGPVSVPVYEAFKSAGASEIEFYAQKYDIMENIYVPLPKLEDKNAYGVLRRTLHWAKNMKTGYLVDLSHAKDGPWDYVVRKSKKDVALGMRITSEIIKERHRNHVIVLGRGRDAELIGDYSEDAPLTHY